MHDGVPALCEWGSYFAEMYESFGYTIVEPGPK